MAKESSIEWTETTWNPVVGCTKISSGCTNCYAEKMAKRLASIANALEQQGKSAGRSSHYLNTINEKGHWNGRVVCVPEALKDPLSWKNPRIIFVNSMSDLFHESVPLSFIKNVFEVMNRCPQHSFQVLTKRPERVYEIADHLCWTPNIWLGTSVENQKVVTRVNHLSKIGAHIRFLSIEPLLGPLFALPLEAIDWVIVGGESGPCARLMKKEWVLDIRDQCLVAGVAFFFKQWGGVNKKAAGRELEGKFWDEMPILKEIHHAQT